MTHLLAISGSLRRASRNTLLLAALAALAPAQLKIKRFMRLAELPLFNVDLEASAPAVIADLRMQIIAADGVIIASPEYAQGVSGVMKNALDWMVGNESFVNKPVMLLNASPRATLAQAALRETLLTMSAYVVDEACVAVPVLSSALDEQAIVMDPVISTTLVTALLAFQNVIHAGR